MNIKTHAYGKLSFMASLNEYDTPHPHDYLFLFSPGTGCGYSSNPSV